MGAFREHDGEAFLEYLDLQEAPPAHGRGGFLSAIEHHCSKVISLWAAVQEEVDEFCKVRSIDISVATFRFDVGNAAAVAFRAA